MIAAQKFIADMQWRYAVKKFDSHKVLSDEQVFELLEAANLSASSMGLQPYRFVMVKNSEIRKKLAIESYKQDKVANASHLIVLAVCANLDENYGIEFVKLVAETREETFDSLLGLQKMVVGSLTGMNEDQKFHWAAKQSYIAMGTLLAVCAASRIDSCPMEGFQSGKFDEILGLYDRKLRSVAAIVLGARADEDEYQFKKKVRRPLSEMVIQI